MPNWCSSDITIKTKNVEDAKTLEVEFNRAFQKNPLKADFGNVWLGNLLLQIGVSEEEVIHGPTRCRGSVSDLYRDGSAVRLCTESAWSPHIKCIKMFVDHYVSGATMLYTAAEPGCEFYATNDPDVVGTVYVDHYNNGKFPYGLEEIIEGCYDQKESLVVSALSEYLGRTGNLQKLSDELNEKLEAIDENLYVSLHTYEYMSIEDCD